jgi:hypothetical protein
MRVSVGIDLGAAAAPDETTVCNSLYLLEWNTLGKPLPEAENAAHLKAHGIAEPREVDGAREGRARDRRDRAHVMGPCARATLAKRGLTHQYAARLPLTERMPIRHAQGGAGSRSDRLAAGLRMSYSVARLALREPISARPPRTL